MKATYFIETVVLDNGGREGNVYGGVKERQYWHGVYHSKSEAETEFKKLKNEGESRYHPNGYNTPIIVIALIERTPQNKAIKLGYYATRNCSDMLADPKEKIILLAERKYRSYSGASIKWQTYAEKNFTEGTNTNVISVATNYYRLKGKNISPEDFNKTPKEQYVKLYA